MPIIDMRKIFALGVFLLVLVSGCSQQEIKITDPSKSFTADIPEGLKAVSIGEDRIYELSNYSAVEIRVAETTAANLEDAFNRLVSYYSSFDSYKVIEDKKPVKFQSGLDALDRKSVV